VTTFNPLFRDEFIILNKSTNQVEHYRKYSFIKLFYCDLEVDIDDVTVNQYRRLRDNYFNSKAMVFASQQEQLQELIPVCGLPNVINVHDVDTQETKKRKLENL
jgi:hypothetical protein